MYYDMEVLLPLPPLVKKGCNTKGVTPKYLSSKRFTVHKRNRYMEKIKGQ